MIWLSFSPAVNRRLTSSRSCRIFAPGIHTDGSFVPSSPCDISNSHSRLASRASVFVRRPFADTFTCVGATTDTFHPLAVNSSYASNPQLDASYTAHTSSRPILSTRWRYPSGVASTVIVRPSWFGCPHTATISFWWTSIPTYVMIFLTAGSFL